jgi:peptide/nickel transport system permease protein
VTEKVVERLPVTLALNAISFVFVLGLAVPLGALAALRPGSALDRLGAIGTHVLYAVPAFWAGFLLQMVFAVRLGWLPLAGLRSPGSEWMGGVERRLDEAAHLVLPAICLGYAGLAYVSRFVRATLLDNAAVEVARGARARGLSELAVLCRHGLRQAAIPMLTLAGFLIPGLLGGSVVVETVFAIPGLGRLFADAAFRRDLPVVMALTLLSGVATVVGILIADLAYAVADPRVRRG